jgi:hypothetical protein
MTGLTSSSDRERDGQMRHLDEAYRTAFQDWAVSVAQWHNLANRQDPAFQAAEARAGAAEDVYRASRDRLAALLQGHPCTPGPS